MEISWRFLGEVLVFLMLLASLFWSWRFGLNSEFQAISAGASSPLDWTIVPPGHVGLFFGGQSF